MSLTSAALKNNRVTGTVIVVLITAGVSAYFGMPQQLDPGFIVRNAQVVTRFPGASPDRVEQLVTDPIEQAVQSIPELDFVSSTSRTGVSVVTVAVREEFKDVRPIWDNLRRKVEAVEGDLPAGIQGPEINDELGDTYPILFSMTGDGFSDRELAEYAETIRDELLHLDGVGKVDVLGDQEERVFVEYENARLRSLGLSPGQLQQALASRNIIMPGGQIDIGPERLSLEPSGNFLSVEDLRRTLIQLPGGGLAYLGDITTITRAYVDPPQGIVTVEGQRALTFAISMSDGDNLVELGEHIRAYFDALPAKYPHGIDFETTYYQPKDVQDKVDEFLGNVLQAVGIVLVVMLLTLGFRTGLIVSSLIPTAMIITIFILSLIGETINQMSLAALIIALGLLVDNAIVVSETIVVRMNAGMKAFQAAVSACRELQTPLLVSSLTTAAAFLPIYLAESAVGEYTGALFTVVSITLLVSWGLALTMTPLLCTLFLRASKNDGKVPFAGAFYRIYRESLHAVLRFRWASLGLVIAIFIGSLQLWQFIPQIFFPSQGSPFFMAALNLPAGTSIETTQQMARETDRFIRDELMVGEDGESGITSWTTFIGETPPPFTLGYSPSPSLGGYCELMVHTNDAEAVDRIMARLQRFVLENYPDVHPHIRPLSAGPPVDKPVQIRISGPETDEVFRIVDQVKEELGTISGTENIDDNWGVREKKLLVTVDEERARRAGVSNEDVARAMQAFLSGMETTRYREDDESIPIVVRSIGADRRDLDRVRNLTVFSQTGTTVPLSQVADVSLAWQPAAVLRRDRYRTVTVEAGVFGEVVANDVFTEIQPFLEELEADWEPGYRWEFGGEFESSVKANASIGEKLPIAGLIIVLLLVAQFNSLRKPVIVLSSIVLALIGVVVGLLIMESSFGFMTLLGVVSLAGIVINNAIVLLDRIQLEIGEAGLPPSRAVIEAAQQRVRPILLTTATTVASLIPLYLSGSEMWKPMAVAIMYGLVFSTFLTLLVVPLVYSILYRVPVLKRDKLHSRPTPEEIAREEPL
ncbi:MAG: efflux RND transporter permease subunit [Myxococcota bacterium]